MAPLAVWRGGFRPLQRSTTVESVRPTCVFRILFNHGHPGGVRHPKGVAGSRADQARPARRDRQRATSMQNGPGILQVTNVGRCNG